MRRGRALRLASFKSQGGQALNIGRFSQSGATRASRGRRIGYLVYAVYGLRARQADDLPWITYEGAIANLPQARWIADRIDAEEVARRCCG